MVNFDSLDIDDKFKLFTKLKVKRSTSLLKEMERRIVENGGEKLTEIIEKAVAFAEVRGDEFVKQGLQGKDVGQAIKNKRRKIFN